MNTFLLTTVAWSHPDCHGEGTRAPFHSPPGKQPWSWPLASWERGEERCMGGLGRVAHSGTAAG